MNHRTQILPGVYLTAVQSDKFKTGCFSLNLLRPMKKEEAAANALIPSVLLRGSVQHPDIASISAKLDELYGASIGTLIRKKGEVQLVGFYCDYVQDEYVQEPVFAPLMEFLSELLLAPAAGKRRVSGWRCGERKTESAQRHARAHQRQAQLRELAAAADHVRRTALRCAPHRRAGGSGRNYAAEPVRALQTDIRDQPRGDFLHGKPRAGAGGGGSAADAPGASARRAGCSGRNDARAREQDRCRRRRSGWT